MPSSTEFKDYVVDQLRPLDDISLRQMMGEYLLYYKGILVGGLYDNHLLLKEVASNQHFSMEEVIPYPNAKPMYLVDDIDDINSLSQKIIATYQGLQSKSK